MAEPRTNKHPLFQDRVPEAAAIQVAVVLAQSMEYHLATLEQMEGWKGTSKGDLERQRQIISVLMYHCRDLRVPTFGLGEEMQRYAAALAPPADGGWPYGLPEVHHG